MNLFENKKEEKYESGIEDLKRFFYDYQIKVDYSHLLNKKPVMSIMQKSILDLFKIDLINHRKARLALHYHLRIQPSEIDMMDYMDFEYLLLDLNELLKEKQEAEKKAYDDSKQKTPDYSKGFKMPKFSMPKAPKF